MALLGDDRPARRRSRPRRTDLSLIAPSTEITLADAVELTVGLSLVFDPLLIVRE